MVRSDFSHAYGKNNACQWQLPLSAPPQWRQVRITLVPATPQVEGFNETPAATRPKALPWGLVKALVCRQSKRQHHLSNDHACASCRYHGEGFG
jgi:hypothetical protein